MKPNSINGSISNQFNPFAEQAEADRKAKIAEFVASAKTAVKVSTAYGPGILIGGEVIVVNSSAQDFHVNALIEALREEIQ